MPVDPVLPPGGQSSPSLTIGGNTYQNQAAAVPDLTSYGSSLSIGGNTYQNQADAPLAGYNSWQPPSLSPPPSPRPVSPDINNLAEAIKKGPAKGGGGIGSLPAPDLTIQEIPILRSSYYDSDNIIPNRP